MTESNLSTENGISLKELIIKLKDWQNYLLSKWMIILLAGIIGASIGLVISLIDRSINIATLSFVIEDEKSAGGGMSGATALAGQFGIDLGGSAGGIFSGSNLLELYKSRRMVEQTLLKPVPFGDKTISYAEWYIQNAQWRNEWAKKAAGYQNIQFLPNADRANFTRVQDSILEIIYRDLSNNGLTVTQKDKTVSVFAVEVKSVDELFAQSFTEAIVKEVSDFYVLTKSKKAKMDMAILQSQTDSIREELNRGITRVAVANNNTFDLNSALNVKRVPSALTQVDIQANTAILSALVQQTEFAKINLRKETPLIQVIDRPILPLKKEKLGKAKGILAGGFLAEFLMLLGLVGRRLSSEISA
jgi:uncharacterized protein involved in exopolysaccharide biosynthesis